MSLLIQLQNSFREVLVESSLPVKCLLLTSLVSFPITLIFPSILQYLAIRPIGIIPPKFCVWTLITYPFLEDNILVLTFSLFCITVASKLLEPLWGYKEFLKFIVISWTMAGLFSGFSYLFVYCLSLNEQILYNRYFYGFSAINGAICIGLKQTRGEDFLMKTPWLSLQINDMPFGILSFSWLITLITEIFSYECSTLLTFGMYSSWLYLRFFQKHSRGTGDMADHFALDKFFPRPLNRFVKVGGLLIWKIVARFGFGKNISTSNKNSYVPLSAGLPGVDNFDAERRRQKALQQLNERLQKTKMMDSEGDDPTKQEVSGESGQDQAIENIEVVSK